MSTLTNQCSMTVRRGPRVALAACAVMLFVPGVGLAQESRLAVIAAQQAAKAAQLVPESDSKGERKFVRFKDHYLNAPTAVYPAFGSVMGGGGITAGLGFRYAAGDTTTFLVKGLWSLKNYKQVDVDMISTGLANGHVDLTVSAGWKDATQVAFHGIGMDPAAAAPIATHGRADYRLRDTWARGDVSVRPKGVFRFGGGVGFDRFDVGRGTGAKPALEDVYTPAQAPGIDEEHNYIHVNGTAGLDWRPSPGYARRGGLYALTLRKYHHTGDRFSFAQVDADVVQHIPMIRESLVFSVRGRVQSILGDDEVPFFMLPYLGSGSTLRGFSSYRFRDRHSLLMSAEYRWTPNRSALDAAIFIDSGKVAAERGDLNFDGLKTSVGLGFRLHTPAATPLRVELAKSNEGLRVVFSAAAAF